MSWWKILLIIIGVVVALAGVGVWYVLNVAGLDLYQPMYVDNCGSCHGEDLEGTDQGSPLMGNELIHGDTVADMQESIRNRHQALGMPAFVAELTDVDVKGLAIYVGERRMGQKFTEFQYDREVDVPSDVISSEEYDFTVEIVAEGLENLIFSIDLLPDGSILVSEKERGLSLISSDGKERTLIEGTPQTGTSYEMSGIHWGSGWLLDVAAHPNYEENGWIYLHYTDLCPEDCGSGVTDPSMNRLDRGRIVDGQWVDVETIWQAPKEFYKPMPDTGAGGRIAFDDTGHVYISVGIKTDDYVAGGQSPPQDLSVPYGKIHRVTEDGKIPVDNPFATGPGSSWEEASFTRQSVWTYGHRSPQGLEFNPIRKLVWNSEMGPRGGDEINELLPGRNYGWPYFSLGLEYSGNTVERYRANGVEFDQEEVEQTLVDITPSPAISSFVFYDGDQFPAWQDNVLIGSLKGSSLFRYVFDGNKVTHKEILIKDLARTRDIEVGHDGLVYLLIEAKEGSRILRMVPTERANVAQLH